MNVIERIKKHPEEIALFFLLLIGAVLRFHHLGFTSLSNDELSALTRTHFSSFIELIEKGVAVDGHPAFVQVLLYYWIKIFGDGVFSIRLPFALAGIISIYFIYQLGTKWFNKSCGLFAAAAFSTLQFPLLFSQLARPYIIGTLFTLMAAFFWTIVLFENSSDTNRKKRNYILVAYILSMSGCMYTHYFSFLEAGIIGLTGLFFMRKETRKEYIFSGIIIILLFVPHLGVFFKQLNIGGIGFWLPKPEKTFLKTFIEYCFNNSNLIIFLISGIFIAGFVILKTSIQFKRYHLFAVLWFLLPFCIGYYYSVKINPVLQYSTLIFAFPFLLLFAFSFLPDHSFNKKIIFTALIVFTFVIAFNTVKQKQYYSTNHFGVFKEIAADAIQWSDKYGENKIMKVISISNPNYINYYFEKAGRNLIIDLYRTLDETDLAQLMAMVDTSHATYVLYGRSNTDRSYEAEKIIMTKFPVVAERDTFFNAEITLFRLDPSYAAPDAISFSTGFEYDHWGDETKVRTDEIAHSGKYSQKMNDQVEYSINCVKSMTDLMPGENKIATATAWINCTNKNADPKLVLSFESNGQPIEWYAANMKSFNLKPGTWQQLIISKPVPPMKTKKDVMKVYVWNNSKDTFYVDDIEVTVEKRNW